ncbi:MAG: hypothetical protein ACHQ6U_08785 [Thermodesulfobacteriota bacterium]
MKTLILSVFISLLLLLPMWRGAFAGDYLKKAFIPAGADDRSDQIYPSFDFQDVVFNREYFYCLQEGKAQYERTYGGTWNALDFGRQILGIGGSNNSSSSSGK